jgi:hypothetical protein
LVAVGRESTTEESVKRAAVSGRLSDLGSIRGLNRVQNLAFIDECHHLLGARSSGLEQSEYQLSDNTRL